MILTTKEVKVKKKAGDRGKQLKVISVPQAKQILKSTGVKRISKDAIVTFQEVAEEILNSIVMRAHRYLRFENKTTLEVRHIEIAVNDLLRKLD